MPRFKLLLSISITLLLSTCKGQDVNMLVKKDLIIMKALKIKVRSSFNSNNKLPKIEIDPTLKGYSAYFNVDYNNPKFFIGDQSSLFFLSPDKYYILFNDPPDSLIKPDSLRHVTSLIHETAHYLEDTSLYNRRMYNPNLVCKEGDMFCYMKHPSEFNAWVVGAYFFLENYSLQELKYIMSTKQDIEQKKIDILNRVYLKILKDKSFKAELMKQDLLH